MRASVFTDFPQFALPIALWCEMNKQYSDHAQSLAEKVWKKPLNTIPVEEMVPAIHALAIDMLRDKDGVYDIRSYFGLK